MKSLKVLVCVVVMFSCLEAHAMFGRRAFRHMGPRGTNKVVYKHATCSGPGCHR